MFDFKLPSQNVFNTSHRPELDSQGFSVIKKVVSAADCQKLAGLFDQDAYFRSTINMSRYGFGRGVYRYFQAPLPPSLVGLRAALYELLLPCANQWQKVLNLREFPPAHSAFLDQCHQAGQVRPTPLLLQYRDGDYNCLHQDLYGDLVFPLQAAILLDRP